MSKEFEARVRQLQEKYGVILPEERKQIRLYLKKHNLRLYRSLEHLKHELLRLETKRAQLDDDAKEMPEIENKILKKREEFIKLLIKARNQGR